MTEPRWWRIGRKVGRTIYLQVGAEPSDSDPLIGVMDTSDLARAAVRAHNVDVGLDTHAELTRLREGNIAVCEDTGTVARDGVCPIHEGDACLVVPGAYVGEVRRLRAEQARTEARLRAIGQAARKMRPLELISSAAALRAALAAQDEAE